MKYVDITKCYTTLMTYIDEDFVQGHEENCKNHFLNYIKEKNQNEIKYEGKDILVPEEFFSKQYITEYIKKTDYDFSAKDCAYMALHRLGIPPIEAMSRESLEKLIRELLKDKAYIKRMNGKNNTLCVDKFTACDIISHPEVVKLIEKQIKKAEVSHKDTVTWRAYEFENKKIAHLDSLSDVEEAGCYSKHYLAEDEKTNLMVKALYGLFFTDFDFEKYESYQEEMMLLDDAWDFGERYQELYDIFSAPNYKYEFYQKTKQDELFETLADKMAEKIMKKIEN